jgi:hypothetical protein
MFRFAVCGACIEEDERPYLRGRWLIGWTGVCTTHNVQLIERCEQCKAGLRVDRWTTAALFAPERCVRCAAEIHVLGEVPADPSASALQQMMLSAKFDGYMDIPGLGTLIWRDFVALADILISGVWKWTTTDERVQIIGLYTESLGDDPHGRDAYGSRHDSLRFLAWLLGGWPDGLGPQVAQEMLRRWLFGNREFASFHLPAQWAGKGGTETYAIDPEMRARIQELHAALVRANPEEPNAVRLMIETPRSCWFIA